MKKSWSGLGLWLLLASSAIAAPPLLWPNGGLSDSGAGLFSGAPGASSLANWPQIVASNRYSPASDPHGGFACDNWFPTLQECAYVVNSLDDLGHAQQQVSWYTRWVAGNNSHLTGLSYTAVHVADALHDMVARVDWSDGSRLDQAGPQSGNPQDSRKPPTNWGRNLGSGYMFDNGLVVGPGHWFGLESGDGLEVVGNVMAGEVDGAGREAKAVRIGIAPSGVAFVNAMNWQTSTPVDLAVGGNSIAFYAGSALALIATLDSAGLHGDSGLAMNGSTGTGELVLNGVSTGDVRLATGGGKVRFGVYSAGSIAATGWITIKSAAGEEIQVLVRKP